MLSLRDMADDIQVLYRDQFLIVVQRAGEEQFIVLTAIECTGDDIQVHLLRQSRSLEVYRQFVFVDAASPTTPKIFHAAMHNESYPTYNIVGGDIVGGNCLLGGTFCGQLPLDPTKESNSKTVTDEEGTKKTWLSNAFAASITMSGASVNWANVFVDKHTETEANQATCMIATGEESHLSTKQCMFHLNTATGETKGEPEMQGFKDADSYADNPNIDADKIESLITEKTKVIV